MHACAHLRLYDVMTIEREERRGEERGGEERRACVHACERLRLYDVMTMLYDCIVI